MIINKKFLDKILSKNGTLYSEQKKLLTKLLPPGNLTKEQVYECLLGKEIGDRRAEELIKLREWSKRIQRAEGKKYAAKSKSRF